MTKGESMQDAGEIDPMRVIQLDSHSKMTVEQCAAYVHRNHTEYQKMIVVGYDEDGEFVIRSSQMDTGEALLILLDAIDYARGISR